MPLLGNFNLVRWVPVNYCCFDGIGSRQSPQMKKAAVKKRQLFSASRRTALLERHTFFEGILIRDFSFFVLFSSIDTSPLVHSLKQIGSGFKLEICLNFLVQI
jgi:hypothetical protein